MYIRLQKIANDYQSHASYSAIKSTTKTKAPARTEIIMLIPKTCWQKLITFFFIAIPPYPLIKIGSMPINSSIVAMMLPKTHIYCFFAVGQNSDFAIPMPVYMASASGGVIPSITPVIAGITAATRNGSMPTAAPVRLSRRQELPEKNTAAPYPIYTVKITTQLSAQFAQSRPVTGVCMASAMATSLKTLDMA